MSNHNGKVQIKAKIGSKENVLHLSAEKAEKLGFHSPLESEPFPLSDFLEMACDGDYQIAAQPQSDLVCEQCGLTFDDLCEIGRFGCGACYDAFRDKLEQLLLQIHGSNRHCGRIKPKKTASTPALIEARNLNDELREAVEMEDYERAAEIRDKLKKLD